MSMETIRVTENEFRDAFGDLSDRAASEPVTITRNGHDHLVVVSAEEYNRLKRGDRRMGLASELPEEWIEAVRAAAVPEEFAHLDSELK
jgi:prevent-host-death family protein